MAAAEINIVPLVNVIESLRIDNASNASEQTRRDSSRDTVLLDINVELVSIKDSILSTRDAIVSTLQSGFGQVQTQNTAAVTNTLKEQFNTSTTSLKEQFNTSTTSLKESVSSISESIVSSMSELQSGFSQIQTQNTAAVTSILKEQFNTHTSALVDSFSSIKESISSISQSFVSTVTDPIVTSITNFKESMSGVSESTRDQLAAIRESRDTLATMPGFLKSAELMIDTKSSDEEVKKVEEEIKEQRADAQPRWAEQIKVLTEMKSHMFETKGWSEHTVLNIKELKETLQTLPLGQAPAVVEGKESEIAIEGADKQVDPLNQLVKNSQITIDLIRKHINVTSKGFKEQIKSQGIFSKGFGLLGSLSKKTHALGLKGFRAAQERLREGGREAPEDAAEEKDAVPKKKGMMSKIAGALFSPFKSIGGGMKKLAGGIQGFLTGLAKGLAAFANPMTMVGTLFVIAMIPVFAAAIAGAIKIFDMILGDGASLKILEAIFVGIGKAFGTFVELILIGIGKMIKIAGPGMKLFMEGIAIIVDSIKPIIKDVLDMILKLLTNPVFKEVIGEVMDVIKVAIKSVKEVIIAFAPVVERVLSKVGDIIIAVADKIEKIVATIGSVIEKILSSFDNVVNSIKPIIEAIGNSISKIIDSISAGIEKLGAAIEGIINAIGDNVAKIGTSIEGVITSIGAAVTKVIGGVEALVKTIGDTVVKIIDGIVTGIERLSGLDAGNMFKVALGLGALAVGLAAFAVGAAVAGGTMPSKEHIEGMAASIERFGKIPADNLVAVGTGMKSLGLGLVAFGTGGALAALLTPGEGGLEQVAKNVEMFGNIPAANLAAVGVGMERLGVGLKEFAVGGFLANLLNDPEGLIGVAASVAKFGKIDATNFNMVGTGIESIGKGLTAFAGGGFLSSLAEGFGSLIGASDPVEKFQKFAKIGPGLKDASEGIKTLSLAMKTFEKTVKGMDLARVDEVAESLAKIRDAQDPGALAKIGGIVKGVGGIVSSLNPFGGDDEEKEGAPAGQAAQTVSAMIADTNRLLTQGFITGPSALFANPTLAESAFLTTKQQETQIGITESSAKTGQKLTELQTESNSLGATGAPVIITNNNVDNSQSVGGSPLVLPIPAIAPGNGGATLER